MSILLRVGQRLLMLCRAVLRLSELLHQPIVLLQFLHSHTMFWLHGQQPLCQKFGQRKVVWYQQLLGYLAIIILAVSPMPMGRTPGFLSRAIRRQATKGAMLSRST